MIVQNVNTAATKWNQRASAAAPAYTSGVANTTKDQAALAAAAEPTWSAAVQTAAANHTYSQQVLAAGTGAWKAGVASKGAARYPQGVAAGQPAYVTGVTPYFNALTQLTLAPRGPKGSNIGRVQAVDDAMIATRLTVK
jgi:hypothetical protein